MSESENPQTPKSYRRPAWVAGLTLAIGALASLAFNIKAISLDHAKALANGITPDDSAYVAGLLAPLFLAMAIELLQHTPWRTSTGNWAKNPDTWVRAGVLILVAGVAAWISYWHGVHVLDSWGYDDVAKRVGPVVPDAAMILATLALHRVGQAKRGHVAATTPVAVGQAPIVATPTLANPMATTPPAVAIGQEEDLATDWATLEEDLDADLAEMIERAKNTPLPATEAPEAPAEATEAAAVRLTTVPAKAAEIITEGLAAGITPAALDEALVSQNVATSTRTARRWRAALANNTARVS